MQRLRYKINAAQRHTFRESRYSAIQPEKRQCRFEGRRIPASFRVARAHLLALSKANVP
jgi:hypothetical protein